MLATSFTETCAHCGQVSENLLRCSACRVMYYCGPAHQRLHWKSHRLHCKVLAKTGHNTTSAKEPSKIDTAPACVSESAATPTSRTEVCEGAAAEGHPGTTQSSPSPSTTAATHAHTSFKTKQNTSNAINMPSHFESAMFANDRSRFANSGVNCSNRAQINDSISNGTDKMPDHTSSSNGRAHGIGSTTPSKMTRVSTSGNGGDSDSMKNGNGIGSDGSGVGSDSRKNGDGSSMNHGGRQSSGSNDIGDGSSMKYGNGSSSGKNANNSGNGSNMMYGNGSSSMNNGDGNVDGDGKGKGKGSSSSIKHDKSSGIGNGMVQKYGPQVEQKVMSEQDVEEMLQQAQDLLQRKQWTRVRMLLNELRELRPHHPHVLFFLGVTCHHTNQVEEAVQLYTEALQHSPTMIFPRVNLIEALTGLGRLREALPHAKTALAAEPSNAQRPYTVGVIYGQLGNHVEAAAHYRHALKLDPTFREAYINCDASLLKAGDLKTCHKLAKQAVKQTKEGKMQFWTHHLQRPPSYTPGLRARPWWDASEFPWVAQLEAAFPDILRELQGRGWEAEAAAAGEAVLGPG